MTELRRVGKYEILEEIGRGGFAVVYKARDPTLDRVVALKVLHPQLTIDPKFIRRFYHEARTAAKLRHPNIVTIYEVGEDAGQHFLAMAFLPGHTLDERLTRAGELTVEQAVSIVEQIASALDVIHGQGLTHRDVKPANIRVDDEGQATLLDFGIVRAAEGTRLTTTMTVLGTPEYMSPEQAKGEEPDARSDIYSLGVVAYLMCTGQEPFSAPSPLVVLRFHVDDPPPSPRELNPHLSVEVERVLLKALAKDPAGRYQTAGEMARALRAAAEGVAEAEEPVVQREERQPEQVRGVRKTRKLVAGVEEQPSSLWQRLPVWAWALLGVLVGVVVVGGWWALSQLEETATETTAPTAVAAASPTVEMAEETEKVPTRLPAPTNTPVSLPAGAISYENVDQVTRLARLGRGTVEGVAYSPNGQIIAVATSLGVCLYDTETLEEVRFIEAKGWPTGVVFSPDGATLALFLDDNSVVQLRQVADGALLHTFEGHEGRVWSVAFSPDGETLASGSGDKTVRLWRISDGELLHVLEGHTHYVMSVAFSSDGATLASGSKDETARLWRVEDGEPLLTLEGHTHYVWDVDFSPDGETLVTGSYDKSVRLWRVSDGTLLQTWERGDMGNVENVAFSPDGETVATGSSDNSVRLWRASDGALMHILEGHTSDLNSVAFSPDGETLVSGADDDTVRLWRVSDGTLLHTWKNLSEVLSVAFSPDGEILASGGHDDVVRLWQVSDGALMQTLEGHKDWVFDLAFSPDGEILASGSDDRTVRLWRTSDGALLRVLEGHKYHVWSVALSPDGAMLASGSCKEQDEGGRCIVGEIRLWQVADGSLVHALEAYEGYVHSVAFSPDGTILASGACGDKDDDGACTSGQVHLWQVADGSLVRTLEGHTHIVRSVVFSPDGMTLASGADDDTVRMWNVADGALLYAPLQEHGSGVLDVAFSPDGTMLASGSYDETVRLWKVTNGAPLRVLEGHAGDVNSVAFSPDGMVLASGSDDGTVQLWGVTGD